MSKINSSHKETTSKNNMFSISNITNIVCPPAPKKNYNHRLYEIIIDDGNLHEVIIHPKKLVF